MMNEIMSSVLRRYLSISLLACAPVIALAQEQVPFPDGCGNPFVADGVFSDFFEKTIRAGVIDAGSVKPADVQLFAVNKIRKVMAEKFPSPAEGEAIDKHVRAQMCVYADGKQGLTSSSVELHKHLQSIAPKLLRDVRKVAQDLMEKEKERQSNLKRYEMRYGLIERAEKLAEEEVPSFLR